MCTTVLLYDYVYNSVEVYSYSCTGVGSCMCVLGLRIILTTSREHMGEGRCVTERHGIIIEAYSSITESEAAHCVLLTMVGTRVCAATQNGRAAASSTAASMTT